MFHLLTSKGAVYYFYLKEIENYEEMHHFLRGFHVLKMMNTLKSVGFTFEVLV